jgi:hypothetical protein
MQTKILETYRKMGMTSKKLSYFSVQLFFNEYIFPVIPVYFLQDIPGQFIRSRTSASLALRTTGGIT